MVLQYYLANFLVNVSKLAPKHDHLGREGESQADWCYNLV